MDKDSFIANVKRDDTYKDIAENIETRFDTSNFKLGRPFPKEKNKKVIGLMKDKFNHLKKFITDRDSIKRNHKEFIKSNKLIF